MRKMVFATSVGAARSCFLVRKRSFPELPSACPAAPEPAGRSRLACRRFVTQKDEVPYNHA